MTDPVPSRRGNRLSEAPFAEAGAGNFQDFVSPDDLSVVFQPIVRLDTGAMFASEALVRCAVPEYASPRPYWAADSFKKPGEVIAYVVESEPLRLRFRVPALHGERLTERIYAQGGLLWCSRHGLDVSAERDAG